MRVVHLITGLNRGGAETMLARLVGEGTREGDEHHVLSLLAPGPVADELRGHGIEPEGYGMRRGWPGAGAIPWLAGQLRSRRPDVLQTWMYHADLLGSLVAPPMGIPMAWNLRQASFEPGRTRSSTRGVAAILAGMSGWLPDAIVCGSRSAQRAHHRIGYDDTRMVHIPNGYDSDRYIPDPAARGAVGTELGIPGDVPLLVHVARFHPQKDHATMVHAIGRLQATWPRLAVALVGDGTGPGNEVLSAWTAACPRPGEFLRLDRRADIPRLLAAADIACLSSRSEGFPNALAEAMLCGTPCASTDVGDAAAIVGDAGFLCAPGDPLALAGAIDRLLSLDPMARRALGERARRRVATRYTLPAVYARYLNLYRELLAARA